MYKREHREYRNLTEALKIVDKMSETLIELSYKFKDRIKRGDDLTEISSDLVRKSLVLKEINDKSLETIHGLLADSMDIDDLYKMINS